MSVTSATTASGGPAHSTTPRPEVVRALGIDAALTAAVGVVLAVGAAVLDGPLGIPRGWLVGLGLFMLVYAADLALMASRPRLHRLVGFVAAGNAVWVLASLAVVVLDPFGLTGLGVAVVVAQAVVVAGFAVIQARAGRG